MKRTILATLLLIAATLTAVPAQAQIEPGRFSASPFFGGYYFDSEVHLKKSWIVGGRVGYDFTSHWGIEGTVDIASTHIKVIGSKVRSIGYRVDGLYHFFPDQRIVPFIAAGVGGTTLRMPIGFRDDTDKLINYGVGVKFFLLDFLALRADVRHLHIFDGMRDDVEYTLGLTFLFDFQSAPPPPEPAPPAEADSDGDGVIDGQDKCPNTPENILVDNEGCPLDADGDGVADYLDKCPGTPKDVRVDNQGCPLDSDSDGVPDYLDKCPGTPQGVQVDSSGCPLDSDGDGVPDYLDECPGTPKGVQVNPSGCPLDSDEDGVPDYKDDCPNTPQGVQVDGRGCPLDSDGDGVADYLDMCPGTEKGLKVDEHGCPPLKKGVKITHTLQMEFAFGKTNIDPKYYDQLAKIADFLQTYPKTAATIEGHTDNVGSKQYNQRLSEQRAESVRRYLVNQFGIAENRLTTKGYGFSRPVADNSTPEGRQRNRRINAVFEATVFK